MREVSTAEQRRVSGGIASWGELTGWVPDNVLFAIRAGNSNFSVGAIAIPIRTPGLIPGPGPLPPPVLQWGGPRSYDC